jgi:hypothetical protein
VAVRQLSVQVHRFSPSVIPPVKDNIFIDITKFENYLIFPVFSGLSDHDGQLLSLHQQELYWKRTKPNYIKLYGYLINSH